MLTLYYFFTDEYWGVPLWGWICIALGIVLIVVAINAASSAKKTERKDEIVVLDGNRDVEAAEEVKLPQAHPPVSPVYPRDGSLPPPGAHSETSKS